MSRRLAGAGEMLARLPGAVAYLAGPELVFEFANDEFRRLVGGRAMLGRPAREALPELAEGPLLARAAEPDRPLGYHQAGVWVRHRGGQPRRAPVGFAGLPVRDGAGDLAGMLLFAGDPTAGAGSGNGAGRADLAAELGDGPGAVPDAVRDHAAWRRLLHRRRLDHRGERGGGRDPGH